MARYYFHIKNGADLSKLDAARVQQGGTLTFSYLSKRPR